MQHDQQLSVRVREGRGKGGCSASAHPPLVGAGTLLSLAGVERLGPLGLWDVLLAMGS